MVANDIAELLKAAPHMHRTARFDMKEMRAYSMGYYAGVTFAIRCAEAAFDKFALRVRTLQRGAREKRSA